MTPNRTYWPKVLKEAPETDVENHDILLTALSDHDCRRILRETTEQALTANELSGRLDLPLSTTYRKLDLLCETTIIQQTHRLSDGGHHATQYQCNFGQIRISLSVSDEALLSVIHTDGMDRKTNGKPTDLGDD